MKSVNFLHERQLSLNKLREKDRKYFQYASYFFGACLLLFIVFFSAKLYYSYNLKSLSKKKETMKNTLISHENIEQSFLILTNKLAVIRTIFENRSNKQEAIQTISDLFGGSVNINDMSFEDDSGLLLLNLSSSNIFNLKPIFEAVDTPETKAKFKSISKSNLARGEDGQYSFRLTIELKNELDQVETP